MHLYALDIAVFALVFLVLFYAAAALCAHRPRRRPRPPRSPQPPVIVIRDIHILNTTKHLVAPAPGKERLS